MSLRGRLTERRATFPDPILGVNLRAANDDLRPTEARLMRNFIFEGGIVHRAGSSRVVEAQIGAASDRALAGHRYYYGQFLSKRLIAYGGTIAEIPPIGSVTTIDATLTPNRATQFLTWSFTGKVYIVNGVDELREYDGTTFQAVSANAGDVAVPGSSGFPAGRRIIPVLDRLLIITDNGLERCDPRDPTKWSHDSGWATLRPSQQGRLVTGEPFSIRAENGVVTEGAIVLQPNAHYFVSGTNFGDDVTQASPSAGEDSSIRILDSQVGTQSPDSVVSVPRFGMFWFTSDLNVFWLQPGQAQGRMVGDKIQSTSSAEGIESMNKFKLSEVWMTYFDNKLILGIPKGADGHSTEQWWMDLTQFQKDPNEPVWYGPMLGQSLARVWREASNSDLSLLGLEGDPSNGVWVYALHQEGTTTDAVAGEDVQIAPRYETFLHHFGAPAHEKRVSAIEMEANVYDGNVAIDLFDLDGVVEEGIPMDLTLDEGE